MSLSQQYAPGSRNVNVSGIYSNLSLVFAARAVSNQGGQPATTTLTFVVPGALATDLVQYSKEESATAASQITVCALANAGAPNATYTITLGAAEAFTACFYVWRAV